MPVHNAEIAAIFEQTAELLEIKGEELSRIRAFRRAARTVEALPMSIATLIDRGVDPATIPGLGMDFARHVVSIVETTRFDMLDTLRRQLPGELGALTAIPGLGPKRVKLLFEHLRVRSIDDLRRAAQEGRLRDIRGLGLAVEKRVLTLLARPQEAKRFRRADLEDEIEALIAMLGAGLADTRIAVAGSVRRRRETVGDVDLLVAGSNVAAVSERLIGAENVADIRLQGPARTTVVLRSGPQVDLRVIADECWGAALLYFTGSKRHNVALRALAGVRGWKLNEYGLFAGKRHIAGAREEDIYAKLGLRFVPPELREDRGEVAAAREDNLPKLVDLEDIRGDMHVVFDAMDAAASEELVDEAVARRYGHVTLVCDGRRLHGAPAAEVTALHSRIDALAQRARASGLDVLKGVEADIRSDGGLDLAASLAAPFDFVAAVVPSHLDVPAGEQVDRLVRTIRATRIAVLSGRRGEAAETAGADALAFERVVAAAREGACVVALGPDPAGCGLDSERLRVVKASGVKIAVGTHAARAGALRRMRFCVDAARRGWLSADDVVNTRTAEEVRALLAR
jgi:DNA polymerase (family 10)